VSVMRSVVLGCGSYLPSRVVTNSELSRMVDTSDEWITQRTGIRERRIVAEGETTSDMGIKAARAALDAAGVDAQSIDLVVLATSTADNTFPASAVVIQAGLGITHGAAFDLQAVCSGFVFSLVVVIAVPCRVLWGWLGSFYVAPRLVMAGLALGMAVSVALTGLFSAAWPIAAVALVGAVVSATAVSWHGILLSETARLAALVASFP